MVEVGGPADTLMMTGAVLLDGFAMRDSIVDMDYMIFWRQGKVINLICYVFNSRKLFIKIGSLLYRYLLLVFYR